MIAVVDYCKGNLKSVERGIRFVGGDAVITDDSEQIASADAIVLPGVGSFADAARTMEARGQMELIRKRIDEGVLFLGICLGLHLMFEEGVEGVACGGSDEPHGCCCSLAEGAGNPDTRVDQSNEGSDQPVVNAKGLAIFPGVVTALPSVDARGISYKVPHVGWNSIAFDPSTTNPLLRDIRPEEYFYFTHSYHVPDSACTVATTAHSIEFPSLVSFRDTAFGVQFHPEKSSDAGAVLLRNFVDLVKGA